MKFFRCCGRRGEKTDAVKESASNLTKAASVVAADRPPVENAEENSNWFSWLFVLWMIKPLGIASTKGVTADDFGSPAKRDEVHLVYGRLTTYFEEEDHNLFRALVRLVTWRTLLTGFALTVLQAASNMAVPYLTKAILNSLTGQIPLTTGQLWGVTVGSFLLPFVGAVSGK
jgi:hypothetical protein